MKQPNQKDTIYEYILQTHQNTLKRYLNLAPRLGPQDLEPPKRDSTRGPIYDKRFSSIRLNKAN